MATFLMLGKYPPEAAKDISAARTERVSDLIRKLGGELKSAYALLGEYDLVLFVELPGIEEQMKISLALQKLTGITFASFPAVTVEQFDRLAGQT
jgi:uncharacterized protein with GYD domain